MPPVQNTELSPWTDEQLQSLPHVGKVELTQGKIIMSPAGFDHGFIAGIILSRLMSFVLDHNLGVVVDSSTGFRMQNQDLLSPDVSFVSAQRLSGLRRFFSGSPDLAVEILSPHDLRADLDSKIASYFQSGTRLVWIVDPARRSVEVLRPTGTPMVADIAGVLAGQDIVPGFELKVSEIFRSYP